MSFKRLFSRSLSAAPDRLHLAAHSHHLWPDASYAGQVECWDDAARLADAKWDRIMGEIWPAAQAEVAAELGAADPSDIVFASNTHDLIVRLAATCPRRDPARLRLLTSDGEFHSARRQFARWIEEGWLDVTQVEAQPFDTFAARFETAARNGTFDLVFVSQVMFGTGRFNDLGTSLADLSRPGGPWVVVDGYHAFMAVAAPFDARSARSIFYLGGGYKYAMSGEGMGFMHCPRDFGPRPPITGWYAEFDDLSLPPGMVGYAPDAMRFMGATFDPSALYRFLHVRRTLVEEGLTTCAISSHVRTLQEKLINVTGGTALAEAELLNPLDGAPHARFLAFRDARAGDWTATLRSAGCVTDVRSDVLRIGLGLYHDESDIDAFARLANALR